VPGGTYEVALTGSERPSGELVVRVGRTEQVLERWPLDGTRGGLTGLVLHLPLRVHSLTIDGDEPARSSMTRLTLEPRLVRQAERPHGAALARRATRYGRARAFFLDDHAFMEPPGFWTRAESATDVVVDAGGSGAAPPLLLFRAGPVATAGRVTSGGWSELISLGPGETRTVTLPALERSADAWVLSIETATGFQPARHDPASKDWRSLGVWVEVQN
jgi:hypothetical protein